MIFEDLHFIVIIIVYQMLVDFVVPDQILDIARIHNTPNGIWSIDHPFLAAYLVNIYQPPCVSDHVRNGYRDLENLGPNVTAGTCSSVK